MRHYVSLVSAVTPEEKCHVPLHQERQTECQRVRKWTLKHSEPRVPRRRKRTPLTVPRRHSLRSGGVKPV